MRLFKYILCFFLAGLPLLGQAQDGEAIQFEMKLSKEKLGINERLRVDFEMNRDGDNFNAPNFEGFRVIMGPSQSISSSWINGKRTYSKTYSYTLAPTSRGSFTIGQASIDIDGQTYKSIPKKVVVTAAVDKPNDQMTVDDIADENLHLVAEVSKTNPYLNEAISVVYKLYASPSINVTNFRPLDNPKYNNFWSQDMAFSKYNVKNGTYNGKMYRYVILKRVVLYPQKSGTLEIEPFTLEVTLDVPTNRRDFFGGRIYTQTNKTVSAGRRTIEVKPLPTQGRPANFSGAVGDFSFDVSASKTELKASESLQATVVVKGKGNLKLFQLPEPSFPSALEVYEPEFEEKVRTTLSGMQGSVSNNYTVVPAFRGKYPIPGISFTYFNPELEKYITLESEEILVNVLEGPAGGAMVSTPGLSNRQVVPPGVQFNFIKLNADLQPLRQSVFFNTKAFYAWILSPLLLIPLVFLFTRKREAIAADEEGNRIKRANRLARKYLGEAKKSLHDKELFYNALERALHNYLKAKLKIETAEFSKEKIVALFNDRGVEKNTTDDFIGLLQNCELARYSPFTLDQMQHDYQKASEVITALDKQL